MAYEVFTEQTDGVTLIRCAGDITLGAATNALRGAIRTAILGGEKKVLIDLGDVKFLDSTGIGEIVAGYTLAWENQARLKLARLPQKIKDVLEVTRLSTVFEVHEDAADAMRAF
jgi:anti-sigma B factor antagonist